MKTIKYLIIAAVLGLQVGCIDKKFEDEFKISITPDAVVSKTTLEISNANGDETPISGEISFYGEGSEFIYTPEGKKEFVVNEGVVTVGVIANANASLEDPITVLGTITAEGYESKHVELTFDGEDEFKYINTTISKIGEEPEGVESSSKSVDLNNGTITEEVTVDVTSNGSGERVEVTLPEGTIVKDEEGNVLDDSDLEFELVSYDLTKPSTLDALSEGGFLREDEDEDDLVQRMPLVNAIASDSPQLDSSGDLIMPLTNPLGFYLKSSKVTHRYRYTRRHCTWSWWRRRCHYHTYYRYNTFTYPARIIKYITPGTLNPVSGNPMKLGDRVTVYREEGGVYRTKGEVSVVDRYGSLALEYSTYSDGRYLFGFSPKQVETCTVDVSSQITLVNNGIPQAFKFVVAKNNRVYANAYMYVGGEMTINLSYAPNLAATLRYLNNPGYSLQVYTAVGGVKVYDKQLTLCDIIGGNIDLDGTSECVYQANYDVKIDCPSVNLVLNYLPVFYKKESDVYYKRFGYINKGYIKGGTPCLDASEKYQFRVLYDNQWRVSPVRTGAQVNAQANGIGFNETNICDFVEEQLK
ncbi:hypothetical protein [Ochrovirga pacifica]|uniref:hypothetical protein n=1 Tax=Ochrovirga pacifica TaxID=1042376 RepID=UPI000255A81A|nr:hypothetical protein [Ochrovirga pacifica]